MDTYIVRVYRYPENDDRTYLGIVEFTDGTPRQSFRSDLELVDIIAGARARGEVRVEYIHKE